jgi:hypothetical protein
MRAAGIAANSVGGVFFVLLITSFFFGDVRWPSRAGMASGSVAALFIGIAALRQRTKTGPSKT